MADHRINLQQELCEILGTKNVYFQPPESVKLQFPCIIYELANGVETYANDMPYTFQRSYQVTLVDKNPDSPIVEKLAYHFPKSKFNRFFVNDNLNHFVFTIYY